MLDRTSNLEGGRGYLNVDVKKPRPNEGSVQRGKPMKLHDILSSDLPEIDESIKECINDGQWLLFKSQTIACPGGSNRFYLKVGQSVYALSELGGVIQEIEKPNTNFSIDELFYFSDLPKPRSLSNAPFLQAPIMAQRN